MSNKSSHHESHGDPDQPNDEPRSRRLHHSWIVWVALVLTFAAILTYVFTMDLATRPVPRSRKPTPNTVTTVP